jgi:hypothetical protein
MQSLKQLIREYFNEQMYECDVTCRSDRGRNLTIVMDNLRGVCGITVVTVVGPAEPVSELVERSILKVKFFLTEPTVRDHIRRMAVDARKIDGVYSFIPRRARRVRSRIYR